MKKYTPILCLDFDGVIQSIRGRWAMQSYIRDLLGMAPASNPSKYDFSMRK